jgi:hypothetical protein
MSDAPEGLKPLAVCENCWLSDHSRWEPESMDSTGNVLMKLVGVDVPTKVNTGEVEICCMCGGLSVSGIYEFKDPSKVYFDDSDESPEFELEMNEYGNEWED